jgi:ATP sulfurylase
MDLNLIIIHLRVKVNGVAEVYAFWFLNSRARAVISIPQAQLPFCNLPVSFQLADTSIAGRLRLIKQEQKSFSHFYPVSRHTRKALRSK